MYFPVVTTGKQPITVKILPITIAAYDTWLASVYRPTFAQAAQRQDRNGTTFTSYNIMDYYYSYRDRITPDQRARIRHVLDYSPLIPGPKIAVENMSRAEIIIEEPLILK